MTPLLTLLSAVIVGVIASGLEKCRMVTPLPVTGMAVQSLCHH